MGSENQMPGEFWQAMGEEFSVAVSPPVAFEDASPHECCEAIRQVFGPDVTPSQLAGITEAELRRLSDAFGAWFEGPAPATARLRTAVSRTLARWPAT